MKPQPPPEATDVFYWQGPDNIRNELLAEAGCYYWSPRGLTYLKKSPYQAGDHLWVKESCYLCGSDSDNEPLMNPPIVYRADGATKSPEYPYVRPSRFMPKWAARLWLEVLNVRAERIREISIDDIEAEGVYRVMDGQDDERDTFLNKGNFMDLWNDLYPGSWERNEFVFVYDLKRIEKEAHGHRPDQEVG